MVLNTPKLHIDVSLVRRLIAAQFPEWKNLSIKPVELSGWDNRTFHLGDSMTVRLPSNAAYAGQVEKEHHWLPKLAPHLPLPISTPLAMGQPGDEYPWHWSIYRWLEGKTASKERIADMCQFARSLAEFLTALQACDAASGPLAGQHNFYRGGPLITYDAQTQQAIEKLEDKLMAQAARAVWAEAISSTWKAHPVWIHGDISIGNLLVDDTGQLSAVIDFGQLGIGDPACDLAIAWTLFEGESRDVFRKSLPLDKATWSRARGWALWKALIVYTGLPGTNPLEKANARRVIDVVLVDR